MENKLAVSNGITSTEGEFSAPFDPTYWLTQLEEYFIENGFGTSSGFIILAKQAWEKDKE